ncbi:hypothetical protein JOQ06_012344, partial [Pogonophryne albipinna]
MPTQKVCLTCKQNIGVASKKCKQCGAIQPYKEKLAKQKEKVAKEWKAMQQKNHSINKVYDSTNVLTRQLGSYTMVIMADIRIEGSGQLR